ncbi:MAG TPA: fibronectin type III domain-containing protein [Candidatus Limnocylindrales bacterium]|nr:fibronectin type III domain-containing protein [Candidatus Limnocylindrales bacterium]
MELLIGALAVLGFLAILVRFLPRDPAGQVRLPRIVDQSIGMWVLRRAIARRRGERSRVDEVAPDVDRSSDHRTAGATATGPAAEASVASPVRLVVSSSSRPTSADGPPPALAQPAPPTVRRPSRALRLRPGEADRRRVARVAQGLAAVVALTTVLVVGFALAGAALRPTSTPDGAVLAATATPGPSPRSTATPVTADTTAPRAAIVGLSKKPIAGSTLRRVTVTWTLTDAGSGIKSQVLQRRIDNGAWETIALPSSTTRSVTQRLPRGHKYTFRVRGVDRSGNVGPFASRFLYI